MIGDAGEVVEGDAGIVTFVPSGPVTLTVPFVVRGDDLTEPSEDVYMQLVSIDGPGRLDDAEGRGRIRDDDEIVFVNDGPPIVLAEGAGQPVTSAAPGATVLIQGSGFALSATAIVEIRSTPVELLVIDTTASGTPRGRGHHPGRTRRQAHHRRDRV